MNRESTLRVGQPPSGKTTIVRVLGRLVLLAMVAFNALVIAPGVYFAYEISSWTPVAAMVVLSLIGWGLLYLAFVGVRALLRRQDLI